MNKKIALLALLAFTSFQTTLPFITIFPRLAGVVCANFSEHFIKQEETKKAGILGTIKILPETTILGGIAATVAPAAATYAMYLNNCPKMNAGKAAFAGFFWYCLIRVGTHLQYNHPTRLTKLANKFQQAKGAALYKFKTESPEAYRKLTKLQKTLAIINF